MQCGFLGSLRTHGFLWYISNPSNNTPKLVLYMWYNYLKNIVLGDGTCLEWSSVPGWCSAAGYMEYSRSPAFTWPVWFLPHFWTSNFWVFGSDMRTAKGWKKCIQSSLGLGSTFTWTCLSTDRPKLKPAPMTLVKTGFPRLCHDRSKARSHHSWICQTSRWRCPELIGALWILRSIRKIPGENKFSMWVALWFKKKIYTSESCERGVRWNET